MSVAFGRVAVVVVSAAVGGCLPDSGDFTEGVVDLGVDGGPEVDAFVGNDLGEPEPNPLDGCEPLVSCLRDCDDALFDSMLFEPTFEGGVPRSMVPMSGTVYPEGGSLVFERDGFSPVSNIRSAEAFADALLCARVRMPGRDQPGSAPRDPSRNLFVVGFLGLDGALQVFLEGSDQTISLLASEDPGSDVRTLGRRGHEWAEPHEMMVLVYLSGDRAYAEIADRYTDDQYVMMGRYPGAHPSWVYFSALEAKLFEPVELLEVRVGIPSPTALSVME